MITKEQGICLTCAHSPECALTLTNDALNGIQFCEEHETVHAAVTAIPSNGKPSRRTIQRAPAGILGLCSNCAQYPACVFPKPEAGVWHCEDYQ